MNRRRHPITTEMSYLEAHPDRTIATIIDSQRREAGADCPACRVGASFSLRHTLDPEAAAAYWVEYHNATRHPRRFTRAALDLPANNP